MDELITAPENEMVVQEDGAPESVTGKVLFVTPETKKIDYKAILGQALQYVSLADIISKIEVGKKYVVQIPTDLQKAFESGEYFMMQNHGTGKMWPTLMKISDKGRNEVVSPLPIVPQDFVKGNPIQEFSTGYHNMLMQQQMAQLKDLLQDTFNAVKSIEHGQMDDRIGLLEAGKNGVALALSMPEGQERLMQINSSRQNLLTAQSQIGETLKRKVSEFSAIPKTGIGQFIRELGKSGYLEGKDQEFYEIQDYYELYLESTKYLAGSYAICGDLKTAENTFKLGEDFLEKIDFKKVKSIGYAHKEIPEMFYDHPVEYVSAEKEVCLEAAKDFDYLAIEVSGEKLLEELNNGRTEQIQES